MHPSAIRLTLSPVRPSRVNSIAVLLHQAGDRSCLATDLPVWAAPRSRRPCGNAAARSDITAALRARDAHINSRSRAILQAASGLLTLTSAVRPQSSPSETEE